MDHIAEMSVLGAMLRDGSIVAEALATVQAEDFQDDKDRRVFEAARALFREGAPVDPLTVLGKLGLDRDKDARAYVAQLLDVTPTTANWREYAALMRDEATLTRIQDAASRIYSAKTLDECREPVAELTSAFHAGRGIKGKTLEELLCAFAERHDSNAAQKPRYSTGFAQVDHLVKLTPGKFVMIAGQPSDGKTALALQWALRMAGEAPVGVYSLETDDETITDRLVTHSMGIDYDHIVDQRLTDLDWVAFAEKLPLYARRNLRVFDRSRLSAEQIAATSTAYGFRVVIVDYGQLIETEHERGVPRAEQLARASQTLKIFARDTDTLLMILLQLKQPDRYKTRDGKIKIVKPTMEDIGETRQWMKDADAIFILSRPDESQDNADGDNPYTEKLSYDKHRFLKIAKNKEGRRGTLTLYFDGLHQTFYINGQQPGARRPSDRKKQEAGNPGQIAFEAIPENEEGMPF